MAERLGELPPHATILALLALPTRPSATRLAGLFQLHHAADLAVIIPNPPPGFWLFLARWLRTFSGRDPPIRVSHDATLGLTVSTCREIQSNSKIPRIWGQLCPLPPDAAWILQVDDSFTGRTYITATDPSGADTTPGPPHIILGPINLINHACVTHNSAIPDSSITAAPRFPPTYLAPGDWRQATTTRSLSPGDPILFTYSEEETLPCPRCPPSLTACSPAHLNWNTMVHKRRDWTHLILADDWIRLAVLAPLSDRPPSEAPTHSVGDVLASLRAALPPFHDIIATLAPHRSALQSGRPCNQPTGKPWNHFAPSSRQARVSPIGTPSGAIAPTLFAPLT